MKYGIEKYKKRLYKISAAVAGLLCIAMFALVIPAMEVFAQTECTVTASSANIRANADVGSTALASVLKGDKLTVTEEVTGADGKVWYKVIIDAFFPRCLTGSLPCRLQAFALQSFHRNHRLPSYPLF